MFIKDGKRFNINASGVFGDTAYPNFRDPQVQALVGITEIDEPIPPEDYTAETYYRVESDEFPYVEYLKRSDEMLFDMRWDKIKAIRDQLIDYGGALVQDKWFHTDPKSKIQFLGLMLAGQNIPPNLQWKTLDGTFITMTPALVLQIFIAQSTRETIIFAVAEQKKQDDSPINEGWPARYVPPEELEQVPEEPAEPEAP